MLKPLSEKTLQKKYEQLGLPKEKLDLLSTYFRCCANLYGLILLEDVWTVFRHYEGNAVKKKDFLAYSEILQREAGLPFSVFEIEEVFSGEKPGQPWKRLIVHNDMLIDGNGRFRLVQLLDTCQAGKPPYLPTRQSFLQFAEDRFYQTVAGKQMKTFIEQCRTTGKKLDYYGTFDGYINDVHGKPVKGKKLSDITFLTGDEQFDLDYYKKESTKAKLLKKYRRTASEKILESIRIKIQIGWNPYDSPSESIKSRIHELECDYGVQFTQEAFEQFNKFYMQLNNQSNLWCNNGWKPEDLARRQASGAPPVMSFGPNIKRLFETGEMNREELEKELKKMGITIVD